MRMKNSKKIRNFRHCILFLMQLGECRKTGLVNQDGSHILKIQMEDPMIMAPAVQKRDKNEDSTGDKKLQIINDRQRSNKNSFK